MFHFFFCTEDKAWSRFHTHLGSLVQNNPTLFLLFFLRILRSGFVTILKLSLLNIFVVTVVTVYDDRNKIKAGAIVQNLLWHK